MQNTHKRKIRFCQFNKTKTENQCFITDKMLIGFVGTIFLLWKLLF